MSEPDERLAARPDGPPSSAAAVRARAPAKINPWLEVLGQRADGYHELRTWMIALELCDELELRPNRAGTLTLTIDGPQATPDIPRDARNLVWCAAERVLALGREQGVLDARVGLDVRLTKHVPSQAGLGGGSSDAAATWIAALAALQLAFDLERAAFELTRLGSDCAFFVRAAASGVGLCEGRGERVRPVDGAPVHWYVAIMTPDVRCPTAAVYAALRNSLSAAFTPNRVPSDWMSLRASDARRYIFNRLEAVALDAIAGLRTWREVLDACDAQHFVLAGSGSSFFGLFDDQIEAQQALARISEHALARGLSWRGAWVTRPGGRGAAILRDP